MASTKAFRISAVGSTATQAVGSDTVDRHARIYTLGNAQQRIAFAEADLSQSDAGFLIPRGGAEFTLQAGDEIWVHGQTAAEASFVYFLITKEV